MKTFKHSDGNTYSIEGNTLYACSLGAGNTSATLPEGVEIIADAIPGVFARSQLASLTAITPLRRIGHSAFRGCSALQRYDFSNVEEIGESAFDNSGLRQVEIASDLKSIGKEAFSYCENLLSVSITAPIQEVPEGLLQGCESLATVSLPNAVTHIGDSAFYHCVSLENFSMPPRLKSIGKFAFYWCGKITNIDLSEELEYLGSYAFEGLEHLEALEIPNSLSPISSLLGTGSPFHTCNGLQHISLPADCSYELVNIGRRINRLTAEETYQPEIYINSRAPNFNCEVSFRPLIFFPRINTSSLKVYHSKLNRAEKNYLKYILLILNRIRNSINIDTYCCALVILKQVNFVFSPVKLMQLSADTSRAGQYVPVRIQGSLPNQEDIKRYKQFCQIWEAVEIVTVKAEPEQSICFPL